MADLAVLAARLGARLSALGQRVTTAESCTGGGVAAAITEVPGSSGWFDGAFVVYSNGMKQQLLGVPSVLIEKHGAVSELVASAMAEGALQRTGADWALAVSGIAGPGGGLPHKPVGTVCFAIAGCAPGDGMAWTQHFSGDRAAVRQQAVEAVLLALLQHLSQ